MITVLWHDRESNGYTDLLPDDWFLADGSLSNCIHEVRGPRSGIHLAKCNVKVTESHADLDYETFDKYNNTHNMYLGIMRIQFESKERVSATQILWKDKGSKNFKTVPTTIGHVQTDDDSTSWQGIDYLPTLSIEGRKKLVTHLSSERNSLLVPAKKAAVLDATGTLACEGCDFTFKGKYGDLGKDFCEVHHRKPLAAGGTRKSNLSDLAILCSNCHSMIHHTDPMLSVEEFREKCVHV